MTPGFLNKGTLFLAVSSSRHQASVLSSFDGKKFEVVQSWDWVGGSLFDLASEVADYILGRPVLPRVLVVQTAGLGIAVYDMLARMMGPLGIDGRSPVRVVSDRITPDSNPVYRAGYVASNHHRRRHHFEPGPLLDEYPFGR